MQERSATLSWRIPKGAVTCTIDTTAQVRLLVDDQPCTVTNGHVQLPRGATTAQLTLTATTGAAGAALLRQPISYTYASARVELPSSYAAQGFGDYAGALTYQCTVTVAHACHSWLLTIAALRGTIAISVNGHTYAPRVWSPYTFDVSDAIRIGENTIELIVTNTLAPYIAGHSPSHYTSPHQEQSGILGLITLSGYAVVSAD
jgi:hypothetical protein